jgi:DNA-binding transcriptional MocR family regulator
MKSTMLLVFLLAASMAVFGQTVGANYISATPQPIAIPDHPQHADQGTLRSESNLRGSSSITIGQGERPLSDFPSRRVEPSLGDVARAYRAEHALMQKATIVWDQ